LLPIDLVGEDVVEVVSSDETIIVEVGLNKDLLDLLVIKVLSEVLGDLLELVGGDLSLNKSKCYSLVDVERDPNFVNLFSAVLVTELGSGQSQELSEVNTSGLIIVKLGQDLVDKLVLSTESKLFEGPLELLGVNNTAEVAVENVEGSLDVLDLLNGNGERGVVFSPPHFFLRGLGLSSAGLCSGTFGLWLAHSLKYLI
jgi:hypothetical protein